MSTKYDVYFSCAMSGQLSAVREQNLAFGQALSALCAELGLALFNPEITQCPNETVYAEEKKILSGCRLMILFLNSPSCGAGGEAVICDYENVPIILVSRDLSSISTFVLANPQVKAKIVFTEFSQVMASLRENMEALLGLPSATSMAAL